MVGSFKIISQRQKRKVPVGGARSSPSGRSANVDNDVSGDKEEKLYVGITDINGDKPWRTQVVIKVNNKRDSC